MPKISNTTLNTKAQKRFSVYQKKILEYLQSSNEYQTKGVEVFSELNLERFVANKMSDGMILTPTLYLYFFLYL